MSAGWHPDPLGRYAQRYHDGSKWTSNVSNTGGVTEEDPLGASPSPGGMPTAPPVSASEWQGAGASSVGPNGFPAQPGSRFLRFLAVLLDGVIIGAPLFLLTNLIWGFTDDWVIDIERDIIEVPVPIEVSVLGFLVSAAYQIGMIGRFGRTIGKMICGLTVVRRRDAAIPGYGTATIRWAVWLIYSLPYVPALGGILLIATVIATFVNPLRQTLHDMAASTVVVKSSTLSR